MSHFTQHLIQHQRVTFFCFDGEQNTQPHGFSPKWEKGFTLLEVMVALTIFAVCALVIMQQSTRSVQQQTRLEEKTLALWVAENAVADMRLSAPSPNTLASGSAREDIKMANREWQVVKKISHSDTSPLIKLDVQVFRLNGEGVATNNPQQAPLISLTSYLPNPNPIITH